MRGLRIAALAGLLAVLALTLSGCGTMIVEDSQPVKIGSGLTIVLFT